MKRIGEIISISKGKKHDITEIPKKRSIRVIKIDDLRNNDNIKYTDDIKGTEVTPKDVLIAWDGANAGTIGYEKEGYIGSTIARLRIREPKKYYTPFLGIFLTSKFKYLRKTATGATIPHISRQALERIKLPEINYNDQIRIATILTQAENLIKKRKESIKALDEFLKSTFLEMFGDIRAKKSNHFWEKPRPYLIAQSGKSSKNVKTKEITEFPIYGGNGINGCATEPLFVEPIVIVGRVGQHCGVIHVSEDPCWVTDNAIILLIKDKKKLNIQYLSKAIANSPILEKVKQLDLPFINQSMILDIMIPLPPIELQNQFATIVKRIKLIKSHYKQSLTELENLYGSLIQRAFKGELDLSNIPIEDIEFNANVYEKKPKIHKSVFKLQEFASTDEETQFSKKKGMSILNENSALKLDFDNKIFNGFKSSIENLALQLNIDGFSQAEKLIKAQWNNDGISKAAEDLSKAFLPALDLMKSFEVPSIIDAQKVFEKEIKKTEELSKMFALKIEDIYPKDTFNQMEKLRNIGLKMTPNIHDLIGAFNNNDSIKRISASVKELSSTLKKMYKEIMKPMKEKEFCELIKRAFRNQSFTIEDAIEKTFFCYEYDPNKKRIIIGKNNKKKGMKDVFFEALSLKGNKYLKLEQVYAETPVGNNSLNKIKRVVLKVVS